MVALPSLARAEAGMDPRNAVWNTATKAQGEDGPPPPNCAPPSRCKATVVPLWTTDLGDKTDRSRKLVFVRGPWLGEEDVECVTTNARDKDPGPTPADHARLSPCSAPGAIAIPRIPDPSETGFYLAPELAMAHPQNDKTQACMERDCVEGLVWQVLLDPHNPDRFDRRRTVWKAIWVPRADAQTGR
jgi:hypothetical protein